jgi:hypothetical protein
MKRLLTREEFQSLVFARDGGNCAICNLPAADAHHIIDRSLFDDNGYFISNGVSLCSEHHLQAEQTTLSCKELRLKAGITEIVLPEHFDTEEEWDHWGNILLPSGARLRGELFFKGNVQKALKDGGVLESFLEYVKYQRTYHLPTSPNLQNDDRQHKNVDFFTDKEVVCSIKLDGEATSMYPNYIHARSVDSKYHESRTWVNALHGRIKYEIPKGFRVCGENVYAKHSIHYNHLQSYFYVYSIWNEINEALSWDDTVEYSSLLGLVTVPVFYRGVFNLEKIHRRFLEYVDSSVDSVEGYVIRIQDKIPYHKFKVSVAKYVRKNHVSTSKFWMNETIIKNNLGIPYTNT